MKTIFNEKSHENWVDLGESIFWLCFVNLSAKVIKLQKKWILLKTDNQSISPDTIDDIDFVIPLIEDTSYQHFQMLSSVFWLK